MLVRRLLGRLAALSRRHAGTSRPPSALLAAAWAGTLLPHRTLSVLTTRGEVEELAAALRLSPAWLRVGPRVPEAPAPGSAEHGQLFLSLPHRPRPVPTASVAASAAVPPQLNEAVVNGGLSEEEALAEVIRRSLEDHEAINSAATKAPPKRAPTVPPPEVLPQTPATLRALHRAVSLGPEAILEAVFEKMLDAGIAADAADTAAPRLAGPAAASADVVPWVSAAAERLAFDALYWAGRASRKRLVLTAIRWGTALAHAASPLHWLLDRDVSELPQEFCHKACVNLLELNPGTQRHLCSSPLGGRSGRGFPAAALAGEGVGGSGPMLRLCDGSAGSVLHVALSRGRALEADYLLARGAPPTGARGLDGQTALMIACRKGLEKVALALLRRDGAEAQDVNARDMNGTTALVFAATSGLHETVVKLLKRGAKPNLRATGGLSAFELAAAAGHCDVAVALINAGASIASTPRATPPAAPAVAVTATTATAAVTAAAAALVAAAGAAAPPSDPLLASLCGNPKMERAVLAMIKRIGPCLGPSQRACYAPADMAAGPLHRCLQNNMLAAAAALIEAGVDLTHRAQLPTGHTPLHAALHYRRHKMLPALIAHGADVNAATKTGRSALSLSLANGGVEDAESTLLLIANGADVNARNPENGHLTPLLELISGRCSGYRSAATITRIARALLERNADPTAREALPAEQSPTRHELPALRSAFSEAVNHGLDELAEAIALLPQALQPPAPPPAAEGEDAPPQPNNVVHCIMKSCTRTALMLLARGGEANTECEVNHELPLRAAAAVNSTSLIAELLGRGARIDATVNSTLETALHVAVIKRHKDAAIALLAAGADPNARTATGDTALTLAASNCTDLAMHMVNRLVAVRTAAPAVKPSAEAPAPAPAPPSAPAPAPAQAALPAPAPAIAPAAAAAREILVDLNARRNRDGKTVSPLEHGALYVYRLACARN